MGSKRSQRFYGDGELNASRDGIIVGGPASELSGREDYCFAISSGEISLYFLSSCGQFTTRVRLDEFSIGACIMRRRLPSGATSN